METEAQIPKASKVKLSFKLRQFAWILCQSALHYCAKIPEDINFKGETASFTQVSEVVVHGLLILLFLRIS